MNENRREKIKAFVQGKGEIELKELEQLFPEVSSMTLRRDLSFLENKGYVVRTWGGAKSVSHLTGASEDVFSTRATENIEAKMIIARKAVSLLETGRSIFIDSGTTTMCLAKVLPDEYLSIFTTGPNIAMEALKNSNPSVTLIGGQLSRNNLTTSGVNSLGFIKNINIDIAVLAASGFSLKSGFTIGNFDECELKKQVIRKARKVILLMDISKLDKNMPYTFCNLKDIDILVCDNPLPDGIVKAAEKNSVLLK